MEGQKGHEPLRLTLIAMLPFAFLVVVAVNYLSTADIDGNCHCTQFNEAATRHQIMYLNCINTRSHIFAINQDFTLQIVPKTSCCSNVLSCFV